MNLGIERREATGDPLDATEASSRSQNCAWQQESNSSTPPGRLKLRLSGESNLSKFKICSERSERRQTKNCIFGNAQSWKKHWFSNKESRPTEKSEKTTIGKRTDKEPSPPDLRKRDLNKNASPGELSGTEKNEFHIGFINIELGKCTMAAMRVVEVAVQMRLMCINQCETH